MDLQVVPSSRVPQVAPALTKDNTSASELRRSPMYSLEMENHMCCSLNSLKGGYIGDYIGDYYRGY